MYERFVLGEDSAWMETDEATVPRLSYCNTVDESMVMYISYDGTAEGALYLGNDQFATYYVPASTCSPGTTRAGEICTKGNSSQPCGTGSSGDDCVVGAYNDCIDGSSNGRIIVSGTFGTVAYNSISATFAGPGANATNNHLYANDQFDYESSCDDGGGNPYSAGERTVFDAKSKSDKRSAKDPIEFRQESLKRTRRYDSTSRRFNITTSIPFYRPDAQTSIGYDFDGIQNGPAADCSDYYLSTIHTAAEENTATLPPYLLLRTRVPGVFVRSSTEAPDAIFDGEYEARYWSVSSHYGASYPDTLPNAAWWTVSARMLNDAAGAAAGKSINDTHSHSTPRRRDEVIAPFFVAFLPEKDAIGLQTKQGLPSWKAPVLTLAGVRCLVLPSPDFVIIR